MSKSTYSSERITLLQAQMAKSGMGLTAIAPTANMRYLLGFVPVADERPCALLLTPDATRIVVPQLNADQVEANTNMAALRWTDAEGPRRAFTQALAELKVNRAGAGGRRRRRADALLRCRAGQPGKSRPPTNSCRAADTQV
jgi:hypothetical protein